MLPFGTRPVIDRIIEELAGGITDVLVLSSRRKKSLEDWFDRAPELEAAFADRPDRRAQLQPPDIRVQFVRQQEMRGTGHALLLAREFAGSTQSSSRTPTTFSVNPMSLARWSMRIVGRVGRFWRRETCPAKMCPGRCPRRRERRTPTLSCAISWRSPRREQSPLIW